VLVNNAGIYPSAPTLELTSVDWARVVRPDTETVFSCSREAPLAMREHRGGSIINIASLSALRPALNQSPATAARLP
jgi:NAD(P)-dependent dehydrogenase (short-subunit alcohol dehydrogenase family)